MTQKSCSWLKTNIEHGKKMSKDRQWLSVICLKASHSIKAICGRQEPKIKLLTVWVKVFERGTWHNPRGKVWVIGSSRVVLTTFPWSAPSFSPCAHPSRETPSRGQPRQADLLIHPALLVQRSSHVELKQGRSCGQPWLSHSMLTQALGGWRWYKWDRKSVV